MAESDDTMQIKMEFCAQKPGQAAQADVSQQSMTQPEYSIENTECGLDSC